MPQQTTLSCRWNPPLHALPRDFYAPGAAQVAPLLLGHWLIAHTDEGFCGGPIVETEAYVDGDPACHAFRGPTPRTRHMFGTAGRAYVYFIYGVHYCFNAVCRPEGHAEAVLVRAIEPRFGAHLMLRRRPVARPRDLTNGPGKLCAAMGIERGFDGLDLCDPGSPVLIATNPDVDRWRREMGPMHVGTRIGLNVAADLPLRFSLPGSPYVSRPLAKNGR